MKFSLITLVFNRDVHLRNMLKGIRKNRMQPDEIVIVNMGETPDLSGFEDLPIKLYELSVAKGTPLPLAKARNTGAQKAQHEVLFFLDVDCVPSSVYFSELLQKFQRYPGILMASPRYLTKALPNEFRQNDLDELSIAHPHRPKVRDCELCNDPGMFWSLCFVISREDFIALGGFDEQFIGYGGEDTDFGFSINKYEYNFYLADAVVYHQQHAVYSPPVQKLKEIVENCRYFYKKWGVWPMGAWLESFAENDLIRWVPEGNTIEIKKFPDEALLEDCYKEEAAFM